MFYVFCSFILIHSYSPPQLLPRQILFLSSLFFAASLISIFYLRFKHLLTFYIAHLLVPHKIWLCFHKVLPPTIPFLLICHQITQIPRQLLNILSCHKCRSVPSNISLHLELVNSNWPPENLQHLFCANIHKFPHSQCFHSFLTFLSHHSYSSRHI